MKKVIFLSVILMALFFSACEKEVITPYVAISGSFTNTPNPAAGFYEILLPDGTLFPSPKQYIVDGTSALFGNVDETKSVLDMSNVAFNPVFGGFTGDVNIKMVDEDGDELKLVGTVTSYADLSNFAYFHFNGGTGKWEDAKGWMNSEGQFDENLVNTLTAEGEVTEPK